MNLATIDWIIIIALLASFITLALSAANKTDNSLKGLFLGGKNLPWYFASISMIATTFAADTPLLVTELVRKNGISGNWLWWSFIAGGMLTTFFFAHLWRRAGVITEAELCEFRYPGKMGSYLRGFKAVYLGLIMNVVIIAWVNFAFMSIIQGFFDVTANEAFLITCCVALLTAIYVSISGLLGVIWSDMLQFGTAMVGCIILAYLVINDGFGGMDNFQSQLTAKHPNALNFFPSISQETNISGTLALTFGSFFAYMGIQWWASWYPGAEPGGGGYIAQRIMSTKSEKDAFWATFFFQIGHYCLRPWPWIIVALATILLYPELSENEYRMGFVLAMKDYMPAGLKGLILAAFFAAYTSTISTQLNWGASCLVNDVFLRFNKQSNNYSVGLISKIATVFLLIIGCLITLYLDTIKSAWEFIIECGAGLGLVLIVRWFWWRINAWSEITAMVVPFLTFTVLQIIKYLHPETELAYTIFPNSFFIIVVITSVCWLTITLITKRSDNDKASLLQFYERVKPTGNWGIIATLSEESSTSILSDRNKEIPYRFIGWMLGIAVTYSLLFGLGYFIFGQTNNMLICLGVITLGSISLKYVIKKFNHE